MSLFRVTWHPGMTVALMLMLLGAGCVIASDWGGLLHMAGIGILVLAAVVHLGTRIWMLRKRYRR